MPILMRKFFSALSIMVVLGITNTQAQTATQLEQVGYLLGDALFYADKYITPITDAAVYQASSSWMLSPEKKKTGTVTVGLHANMFFVPKSDRKFNISNDDFLFFEIENQTQATVPSALGNDYTTHLIGDLDGEQIRIETPEGVDMETIVYPYLTAAVALPYGTELVVRYSTKTKLKRGYYQVYGLGIQHNVSQYFSKLKDKNIDLAYMFMYSNEEVSFDFLDVNTPYGNLGINKITGFVNTWHFECSASKTWGKTQVMGSLIGNRSFFEYKVSGKKGEIENILPVQSTINNLLTTISDPKTNILGEVSCRYQISKIYLQSSVAFGKFVNANIGIHYQL